jgi:hypothetical protein
MATRLNKNFTHFKNTGVDIEFVFSDIADLSEANEIEWAFGVDEDSEPLITKSTADGITINEVDTEKCTVRLDPGDTETLTAGSYYHQLRWQDDDMVWHVSAAGTMTLLNTIFDIEGA